MLDVLLATLLFILLCPVFIIVAFLVLWQLGLPIFNQSVVSGLNGKLIRLYTFRTSQNPNSVLGIETCERETTSMGDFLRRYRLHEIPFLISVIAGEMSIVGPAPQSPEYVSLCNIELVRRYHIKPGMTGWTQINGSSEMTWQDAYRMDVWYVDHRDVMLDIQIIKTTFAQLCKQGFPLLLPVKKVNRARV